MKYTDALYGEENTLTAKDLDDKYNQEGDGEHPVFSAWDWRQDVASQSTRSGYWDWVQHQIASWEPDQDGADLEAAYRQRAIELHGNDECEFDDNCAVSIGENGAFVAGWIWVPEDSR